VDPHAQRGTDSPAPFGDRAEGNDLRRLIRFSAGRLATVDRQGTCRSHYVARLSVPRKSPRPETPSGISEPGAFLSPTRRCLINAKSIPTPRRSVRRSDGCGVVVETAVLVQLGVFAPPAECASSASQLIRPKRG
jgi:hypothetical protein